MSRFLFCLFSLLTASGALAAESDWPQFRGPHARGVAEGFKTPDRWDTEMGDNIRWQTPVPGLAHSCPIVWGDKVFVTSVAMEGEEKLKVGLYGDVASVDEPETHRWLLMCVDKTTGNVAWQKTAYSAVPRIKRHPKGSHCSSTPATDGKHIVAMLGAEGLFCFDMEGKLSWKKDFGRLDSGWYRDKSAEWGFASSPVISGDRVIVQCDVQANSFLAAFALEDGKQLWRMRREDVPTWSTPAIDTSGGRAQVIVNGWRHAGGYDLETGKQLWRLNGGGDIPVPTPVVAHGLVYLTSAHGQYSPIRAIRLDATEDITPPEVGGTNSHIAWSYPRGGGYMQTPIVVGELYYTCNDGGVLSCYDARTGQKFYSERIGTGGQGFTASPVSADGKLYVTSETGNVFVIPVGKEFKIAGPYSLGETCMATPAVSEGTLFFRTRHKLVAIGSKKEVK